MLLLPTKMIQKYILLPGFLLPAFLLPSSFAMLRDSSDLMNEIHADGEANGYNGYLSASGVDGENEEIGMDHLKLDTSSGLIGEIDGELEDDEALIQMLENEQRGVENTVVSSCGAPTAEVGGKEGDKLKTFF